MNLRICSAKGSEQRYGHVQVSSVLSGSQKMAVNEISCHLNYHDLDLIVLISTVEEGNAGVFQQGAQPLLRVLDFSEKLHYLLCCGVLLAWLSSFTVNRGETGLVKNSSLLLCFIC